MSDATIVREPPRAAGLDVDIERVSGGEVQRANDLVVVEEPLEIRLNGWRWLVTMRTPGDDADLLYGMLASEGVIGDGADVESIVFTRHPEEPDLANVADVRLTSPIGELQRRLARHQVLSGSSCGLCGKSTVEALLARQPPLSDGPTIDAAILGRVPDLLASAQPVFRATGGLHAAALLDAAGNLLVAREDIGRHNAVDKVLGWRLRAGTAGAAVCVLVVSGRASFEIVQKALSARVAIVAAVSAASSLAVTLASDANMTLAGFVRRDGYNVYAGGARLTRSRDRNAAAPTPDDATNARAAAGPTSGRAVDARDTADARGAVPPVADAVAAAEALAFIPTSVRCALDDVMRKISLVDWEALTLDERRRLVELSTAGSRDAFFETLTAVVLARTGREPRPLTKKPEPK